MHESPKVAVLMGSRNDAELMAPAERTLEEFGVPFETHVMSAHRTPDKVAEFATNARDRGFAALICGAGMAAVLAGAVAAHTTLPVIGVPLAVGPLQGGWDALLGCTQLPTGAPVASVALNGAVNGALLAIEILAITDERLAKELEKYRDRWRLEDTRIR